jgi:hypothetical protein
MELGRGGGTLFYLNYLPMDLALTNLEGTKFMLYFPSPGIFGVQAILQILLGKEDASKEATQEAAAGLLNDLIKLGLSGKRYQMESCPNETHMTKWNEIL